MQKMRGMHGSGGAGIPATWANALERASERPKTRAYLSILAIARPHAEAIASFARLGAVWANVPNWKNCACGLPFAECDSVSFSLVARGRYNVSIHCRTHEGDRT